MAKAGSGLAFVVYPVGLGQMPLGWLFSIFFFSMLICLGIDTEFSLIEAVITAIIEGSWMRRVPKEGVGAVVCVAMWLIGFLLISPYGPYWVDLIDTFSGTIALFVVALFEVAAVSLVYGMRRLADDVQMMTGRRLNNCVRAFYAKAMPILLLILIFCGIYMFAIPEQEDLRFLQIQRGPQGKGCVGSPTACSGRGHCSMSEAELRESERQQQLLQRQLQEKGGGHPASKSSSSSPPSSSSSSSSSKRKGHVAVEKRRLSSSTLLLPETDRSVAEWKSKVMMTATSSSMMEGVGQQTTKSRTDDVGGDVLSILERRGDVPWGPEGEERQVGGRDAAEWVAGRGESGLREGGMGGGDRVLGLREGWVASDGPSGRLKEKEEDSSPAVGERTEKKGSGRYHVEESMIERREQLKSSPLPPPLRDLPVKAMAGRGHTELERLRREAAGRGKGKERRVRGFEAASAVEAVSAVLSAGDETRRKMRMMMTEKGGMMRERALAAVTTPPSDDVQGGIEKPPLLPPSLERRELEARGEETTKEGKGGGPVSAKAGGVGGGVKASEGKEAEKTIDLAMCFCKVGWGGNECDEKLPPGENWCPEDCNSDKGRGVCDKKTGFCMCATEFVGPSCNGDKYAIGWPPWAIAFGWLFAMGTLLPIPLLMLWRELRRRVKRGIDQREVRLRSGSSCCGDGGVVDGGDGGLGATSVAGGLGAGVGGAAAAEVYGRRASPSMSRRSSPRLSSGGRGRSGSGEGREGGLAMATATGAASSGLDVMFGWGGSEHGAVGGGVWVRSTSKMEEEMKGR